MSVLSSVESFDRVLLDDYEVHPFADSSGVPNKTLFRLLLTYFDNHYKMIIRRKETNGFGDKSVLALQAQCASLTTVEQNTTQREFTGMRIAPRESLSFYLHQFSMARDKAETAGNEFTDDALVDYFYLVWGQIPQPTMLFFVPPWQTNVPMAKLLLLHPWS